MDAKMLQIKRPRNDRNNEFEKSKIAKKLKQ